VASKAVHYGAYPVVALAATVMLETGERGSLSQAADGIQAHFHVSDFWIGALPTAMTLIGVLGSIPFGHLADRTRRTFLLAAAMAVWTLVMGLNALAPTFIFLFLTRLGVGVVEANGPAAISLLSDYYPVSERAKRIGLYNSGALVGARPRPRRCVRRQLGLARCVLDVDPLRDRNGVDAAASTGAGTG
jgi:MFS family permease